ncbi:MAG: hypothetical protein FWH20_00385 [Oscillospiraceae bacterium]|nr:hypothetical protein [Oscillospiraceae bacterium]
MNENTGTCRFCGQNRIVDEKYKKLPGEKRDEAVTNACTCPEARRAVRVKEQIEKARNCINQLCGEEAASIGISPIKTEAIEQMYAVVDSIANGNLRSATLQICSRCKVVIGLTSKGTIKVKRTDSKTHQLEE